MAPALIATGVALLLAQSQWPLMPVATAMALVALGAIIVTITHTRPAGSWRVTLLLSLFIYASLYLLLVGAIFDAATRGQSGSLTLRQLFDLGASAFVMLLAARTGIFALATVGTDSRVKRN